MAIIVGVLASGEGTMLQSIVDACAAGRIQGDVAVVISNNSGSGHCDGPERLESPLITSLR